MRCVFGLLSAVVLVTACDAPVAAVCPAIPANFVRANTAWIVTAQGDTIHAVPASIADIFECNGVLVRKINVDSLKPLCACDPSNISGGGTIQPQ